MNVINVDCELDHKLYHWFNCKTEKVIIEPTFAAKKSNIGPSLGCNDAERKVRAAKGTAPCEKRGPQVGDCLRTDSAAEI